MKYLINLITFWAFIVLSSCASPPTADPSKVEAGCAQECSGHLAECSSGFKFFPVVAQQQCNDTYDVCIKGCPARNTADSNTQKNKATITDRLKKLDELLESGTISKREYENKRKDILNTL